MVTLLRLIKFFFFISALILLGGFYNGFSFCEEDSLKELTKEEESETEKPLLNRKYWILGGIAIGAVLGLMVYFFPPSFGNMPNSNTGDVRDMGSSGSIAPATSLGLAAASAASAGVASVSSASAGTLVLTPEVLKVLVHSDILSFYKYSLLTTVAISQIYKAYPFIQSEIQSDRDYRIFNLQTFKYPDLSHILPDAETVRENFGYTGCESFKELTILIQTDQIDLGDVPIAVLGVLYNGTMVFKTLGYSNLLTAYIMESCKYMSQYKSVYGLGRLEVEDIYVILDCIDLKASNVFDIIKTILNSVCFFKCLEEYHSFVSAFPRELWEDFVLTRYEKDIGEVPWYLRSLSRDILKVFLRMEDRYFLAMEHVDMHKLFFHSLLSATRERFLANINTIL